MSEEQKGFFTKAETEELVDAISSAEKQTSGEIRVHIEQTHVEEPMERAVAVFSTLGMDQTKDRNGVLFYVGIADHTFIIIGDKGINDCVEPNFWDDVKDQVIARFKRGEMKVGLIEGIQFVGEKLSALFPFEANDCDELSNEISGNYED